MSRKVHHRHRPRTRAGQKQRYEEAGWRCVNCGRNLRGPRQLCRKLRNCPGRLQDRLYMGEDLDEGAIRLRRRYKGKRKKIRVRRRV